MTRTVTAPRPADAGRHDGLAYSLWLPAQAPRAGVVILHGAGSCKESHHDYARALIPGGLAAITFDQRGHGESDGPMDGRALEDVGGNGFRAALRPPESRSCRWSLRGSSMGGCLALLAAPLLEAPSRGRDLPRKHRRTAPRAAAPGRCGSMPTLPLLDAFLAAHDLHDAVAALTMPVLLLHAAGDEQVPVEHSRELAAHLRSPSAAG